MMLSPNLQSLILLRSFEFTRTGKSKCEWIKSCVQAKFNKCSSRHESTNLFDRRSSSGFRVPDDDTDVSSREGSVQILDSHRRTFSVPSTDSESDSEESIAESIEVASSVQGEAEKDSEATTPDHGANINESICLDPEEDSESALQKNKGRDLNLKGPSIEKVLSKPDLRQPAANGSSQRDAIDLDEDNRQKPNTSTVESDNEGPEILPIHQTSSATSQSSPSEEPQGPRPCSSGIITDDEEDLVTEDQVMRIIVETQARVAKEKGKEPLQHHSPEAHPRFITETTDGFDSTDDDGFDNDDFSDYGDDEDCLSRYMDSELQGTYLPQPKAHPVLSKIARQDSALQDSTKARQPDINISEGIDVSLPAYPGSAAQRHGDLSLPTMPRAPSPSDAALARNHSFMPSVPSTFVNYHGGVAHGRGTLPSSSTSTAHGFVNNVPFGYQSSISFSHPDYTENDGLSKPYDQGPFASRYQTPPFVPLPYENGPSISRYPAVPVPEYPQWSCDADYFDRVAREFEVEDKAANVEPSLQSSDYIAADARFAAKLQAEEDAFASATQASIKTKTGSSFSSKSHKGVEGQSSKINIANLVNSSHTEDSRPQKRKANEISDDTVSEQVHVGAKVTKAPLTQDIQQQDSSASNGVQSEQETQLPDAQAKEVIPPVDQSAPAQDSALESMDSLTSSVPVVVQAKETEEPARKKTKTSHSNSKGIGKFVSGVCVGLVGAFAAFVATIPASVREEALRELSNAA